MVQLPDELKVYLDNLTPAEGDRVLTGRLTAGTYITEGERYFPWFGPRREPERCLVGCVLDMKKRSDAFLPISGEHAIASGFFETLCGKYGLMPTVTAIRLHILQARLKRELAQALQPK